MSEVSGLEKARSLFGVGKRIEARDVLVKAIRKDPKNPDIWFGLSYCVEDIQQKKDCLEKVLFLAPNHLKAKKILEQLLIGVEPIPETQLITQVGNEPIPVIPESKIIPGKKEAHESKTQKIEKQAEDKLIDEIELSEVSTQSIKKAGESTFLMAEKWRRIGLIGGVFFILLIIVLGVIFQLNKIVFHNSNVIIPLGLASVVVYVVSFIFINKLGNRMDNYRHGAIAEELVGEILKHLQPDYIAIHDIQLGYGNIDHFVIGKNGNIYMIETKSHRGKVTIEAENLRINNKRPEKDFIKQAQRNAFDLRDEIAAILGIDLRVTPILVFTNAYMDYQTPIKGVYILNKKFLLKFIKAGKELPNHAIIWEKRGVIQEFLNRPRW